MPDLGRFCGIVIRSDSREHRPKARPDACERAWREESPGKVAPLD